MHSVYKLCIANTKDGVVMTWYPILTWKWPPNIPKMPLSFCWVGGEWRTGVAAMCLVVTVMGGVIMLGGKWTYKTQKWVELANGGRGRRHGKLKPKTKLLGQPKGRKRKCPKKCIHEILSHPYHGRLCTFEWRVSNRPIWKGLVWLQVFDLTQNRGPSNAFSILVFNHDLDKQTRCGNAGLDKNLRKIGHPPLYGTSQRRLITQDWLLHYSYLSDTLIQSDIQERANKP